MPATLVPWVAADTVAADRRVTAVQLPDAISWATIVQQATEILFQLSGMRFPGLRTDHFRPHRLCNACRCDIGYWSSDWSGVGGWWDRIFPEGWGCTCSASNELVLPGAPVASITQITVDGVVLDPDTYALYNGRRLVRLQDPDTGAVLGWPCCQSLAVPVTAPGTWEVVYQHGSVPPISGISAAYALSIELGLVYSGDKSRLPQRTQSATRNGVTINIAETVNLLKDGKLGFWEIDLFLSSFNPNRISRRARVFSPDAPSGSVSSSSTP